MSLLNDSMMKEDPEGAKLMALLDDSDDEDDPIVVANDSTGKGREFGGVLVEVQVVVVQ